MTSVTCEGDWNPNAGDKSIDQSYLIIKRARFLMRKGKKVNNTF